MKDKLKGKAEELKGRVRNDPGEEMKGRARQDLGEAKDQVRDARRSLSGLARQSRYLAPRRL